MNKILTYLAPMVLLIGCCTPKEHTVHIDSEPKGVRVFFSTGANSGLAEHAKNYLGVTPFDWKVTGDCDDYFETPGITVYSSFVQGAAVFYAEPPNGASNLFAQSQVFRRPAHFVDGDKIPEGVFFDLTKPAPPPKQVK